MASLATMPPAPDPAAVAPPKVGVFLRRLLSFLVLWIVMLAVMLADGKVIADAVLLLILVIVAAAGLVEYYLLGEKHSRVCCKGWGLSAGTFLIGGTFLIFTGRLGSDHTSSAVSDLESGVLFVFVLGLCVWQLFSRRSDIGFRAISVTLFGLLYVPWLLNFMQKIYFFPDIVPHGRFCVLYLIAVTKFSDTGAYIVGAFAGRHPMAPGISRGKTWEGFCGAILFSTGTSVAFAHLAGDKLAGMGPSHAAVLGVILGLAAVAGDLTESLFKREAGVKDSGAFFPGIGGVLDVIDSLLFTAPVLYLCLRFGGMLRSS